MLAQGERGKKPLEQVTDNRHKTRKSLTSAQWSAEPKLSLLSPQRLGPKEGQGDVCPLPRHLGRIEETSLSHASFSSPYLEDTGAPHLALWLFSLGCGGSLGITCSVWVMTIL